MTRTGPLAPQPMTAAQVADLVERVRSAPRAVIPRRPIAGKEGKIYQAARLAHERGITLTAAAAEVGVASPNVSVAYRELYGTSGALGRRRVAQPEDEVSW